MLAIFPRYLLRDVGGKYGQNRIESAAWVGGVGGGTDCNVSSCVHDTRSLRAVILVLLHGVRRFFFKIASAVFVS